jgi:hypothetical protein
VHSSDITIPDYPPPSFQEAISTPVIRTPIATPPNTDTFEDSRSPPPPPHSNRTAERSRASPVVTQSLAVNVSDSGSETGDSSLEVVELEPSQTQWEEDRVLGLTLEQRVKREKFRRGVQEDSTPSLSSQDFSQNTSEFEGPSRPGRGVLESDSEDEMEAEKDASFPPVPTSRKYLSPLRALSLSPSKAAHDRAVSAHPSGSPYSFTRSGNQFLKSSTSLYRLPMSNSSPSVRGEGLVSRKLFSQKGKEALDSWEVVDSDVPSSPMVPPSKNSAKFTFPSTPRLLEHHTHHTPPSPFTGSHDQQIPRSPTTSKNEKSLTSFLNRPVRRPILVPQSPGLTSSTPTSSPPVSPTRLVPPNNVAIISLRIPKPGFGLPGNKSKGRPPQSPLSRDYERSNTSSPITGVATTRFERQLETSPPPTPSNDYFSHSTPFSGSEANQTHTVVVNTPSLPPPRSQRGLGERAIAPRLQTQEPIDMTEPDTHRHYSLPTRPTLSKFALSPLSLVRAPHHYPGRPLPLPPPVSAEKCPEGLLIDFEGSVVESDKTSEKAQIDMQLNSPTSPSSVVTVHHSSAYADFDPLVADTGSTGNAGRDLGVSASDALVQTRYPQPQVFPPPAKTPSLVRWTHDLL